MQPRTKHIRGHCSTLCIAVDQCVQVTLVVAHAGDAPVDVLFFNGTVSQCVANVIATLCFVVVIDVLASCRLAAQASYAGPAAAQGDQKKADAKQCASLTR